MSGASNAVAVTLAALGFVAGGALLDRVDPQRVPVVTPKHEHLEAHRDAYTVLFIGTSVMYRHVVPDVFAEEMRRLGHDERAFNFGVAHMTLAEADLVLERVLALHSTSIKTVVLDLSLYVGSGAPNHFTTRHIWWHTPEETFLAVENDLAARPRDWDAASVDLRAFAINATRIGRASRLFQARWDKALPPEDEDDDDVEAEGYRSLEDASTRSARAWGARFAREKERYGRELDARAAHPPRPIFLTPYQARRLEHLAVRCLQAGLTPVLYESANHGPPLNIWGKLLRSLPVVSFNDLAAYPDLYRFEVRFDRTHLNREGALILTRHLAEALTARLYPAPGAAPQGAPR